uniref:ADP-ribosylhydrolase like 1 n=1 Tax=Callorhinchus milii TaxID=7868 RepID=A0A4W3J4C7_CALMI
MDRYEAAMVLGALGNAMGFHNTNQECKKPGLKLDESDLSNEIDALVAKSTQWKVSFDTLMHLATAEALTSGELVLFTCRTVTGSCHVQFTEPMFGAAARTMCIGMRFSKPQQLNDLLQASIECGRMTHSFPTAFLGTFCTALFASYAIQGKPIAHWGWRMMEVMPIAEQYCEKKIAHFSDYRENWFCFETIWQFYLKLRGIQKDGCDIPVFPKSYKIEEQNKLYRGWRSESSGKQKGLETTLIAYDALLVAGGDWKKLCYSAMFHWGESDVTGAIAGCLYGIQYGFDNVPSSLYLNLEFKDELEQLGRKLYYIANPER